jgi:LmbE family N-acetylglucosaminyl deacetylase
LRRRSALFVGVVATAAATAVTARAATLVVLAPHPDDGEASCGGLIANAAAAGHEVVVLTMTGGELGVQDKGAQETRLLRTVEAREAASQLGARAGWRRRRLAQVAQRRRSGSPTPWSGPPCRGSPRPLDVHADHQAMGLSPGVSSRIRTASSSTSTRRRTRRTRRPSSPRLVDITEMLKKKVEAASRHRSQNAAEWMEMYVTLARVRGWDADVPYAEAYVKARNSSGLGGRSEPAGRLLPGLRAAPARP